MPTDPPRRRRSDEDRRRWSDDRLDDLADDVRGLAPLVKQVAIVEADVRQHGRELADARQWIKDAEARLGVQITAVAKSCEDFRAEYRADQKQARTANRTLVLGILVAIIGAVATIAAAVIAVSGGMP